jgi:glyoxylate/hydroxypyruvate reductase A
LPGVASFAGASQIDEFLAETDVLVSLLPLTRATRGIINSGLLRKLSTRGRSSLLPGPVLINAGRGGLQVDADIHAALKDQTLYAASLDVFEVEPLPADSPLWSHPRVVITPHNAAESDPEAIAAYALKMIRLHSNNGRLDNLIDVERGY